MDTQLADITTNEESNARSKFHGSDFQKFLHNDLCKRLHELRLYLENVDLTEVQLVQGKIQELKSQIELLHAGDSDEVRKIYGR